jgi:bifunctional DNA-binding transcriptional regulator/antitoxin component of YhaV-PrlF toxin-antitoxin module
VNDSDSVAVPTAVRRAAGIEPGDTLRWRGDADGTLSVEVVTKRHGAFSELDPVETDEAIHAAEDHDLLPEER